MILLPVLIGFLAAAADTANPQFVAGKKAILSRTGCFLVDYSFVETEAVQKDYKKDNRVYDVNRDKSVKEWIVPEELSPTRIKLQHVLFSAGLDGKLQEGAMLKHTGEDWEYNAPFLYDYVGHNEWTVKELKPTPNIWTRRVTSLDDGLRYQCAASFDLTHSYGDWQCSDYAPIPGRETRDMGRKDYQGLQRSSRIISYGASWLERERNTKVSEAANAKTDVVKEFGKTWYVRLPDSECSEAKAYTEKRMPFWLLLGQTWDGVLNGEKGFADPAKPVHPSRYEKIMDVEEQYLGRDLNDPALRAKIQKQLLKIIDENRSPLQGSKASN